MKKLLLFACIISYTFNLSAQCNDSLPIFENFSDAGMISVCWDFIDADGDTYGWYVGDLGGNNGLVSESYTGATGYLTPDNWAITYAIDLTSYSNVQLSWKVRAPDWSFDQERYSVYAATGNQISDFTSSSVSVFENLDDTDASGSWGDRSLDLSSLSGQTVYIAFRHWASVFQDQINIDDMELTGSTLGVDDFETATFKHYYNTVSNILTIKSSNSPINSIEIFNILGQNVLNRSLSQSTETVNLSTLKDGIYISRVTIGNASKTIKFLKQ